jgi:hypothetical protein
MQQTVQTLGYFQGKMGFYKEDFHRVAIGLRAIPPPWRSRVAVEADNNPAEREFQRVSKATALQFRRK